MLVTVGPAVWSSPAPPPPLQTFSAYYGLEAGSRDIKLKKAKLDSLQEFSVQGRSVAFTVQP